MNLNKRRMPAEWEYQSAMQLTMPHKHTDWAPILPEVMKVYEEMKREISKRERLIIVDDIPHNDTWARDHGFITVFEEESTAKSQKPKALLLDFCFNGWGEKFPAELDNEINRHLYERGIVSGTYEPHLDFVLEGGVTPPPPGVEIFSESFSSGQGNFTIQDVTLPEELTYVWQHDANYSCMKASAYVGQAYAAESWLVSPAIDLMNYSTAMLKFDQAVNYASPDGVLKVMISTDYDGDVLRANWTELNLSAWPAGSNWTFINSTADLSQFTGQMVTIAFKYTSTSSASATWEVKNFVVEE